MKITDVEVLILEAPGDYAAPAAAEEAYGFKHLALLRVHTDEGITGPSPRFTLERAYQFAPTLLDLVARLGAPYEAALEATTAS